MPVLDISEEVVEEIAARGRLQAPVEACGLLFQPCFDHPRPCERLKVLENIVGTPRSSSVETAGYESTTAYEMDEQDIWSEVEAWWKLHPQQIPTVEPFDREHTQLGIVIWHTHPSGFVGPSSGDLRTKVEGFGYLVVALTPQRGVPVIF